MPDPTADGYIMMQAAFIWDGSHTNNLSPSRETTNAAFHCYKAEPLANSSDM